MADKKIGLAEAVSALREELERAIQAARGDELTLKLDYIELEAEVEITLDAGAMISWCIVNHRTIDQKSRSVNHRLKINLKAATSWKEVAVGSLSGDPTTKYGRD